MANAPIVQLICRGQEIANMPASEALQLAYDIQLAAMAAMADRALLVALNTEAAPELSREQIGDIITEVRHVRRRMRAAQGGKVDA